MIDIHHGCPGGRLLKLALFGMDLPHVSSAMYNIELEMTNLRTGRCYLCKKHDVQYPI